MKIFYIAYPLNCRVLWDRRYRISSFLDIGKKFRQYGKIKDTFRGSNLAKESVYKPYITLQDIMTPYLDTFWLYMLKKCLN